MFSSKRVWNRLFANPVSSTECLPRAENGSPQLGSWADFLVRWRRESRIISLISPCVFGLAVSHRSRDYVGRVQRRHSRHSPTPLPWTAVTCRLQRTLGLSMLYCTELRHLTLTHRMSADCSFWKCHITLSPLRNDFWLFRNKIKKSVDFVVSSSELKSCNLWMEN